MISQTTLFNIIAVVGYIGSLVLEHFNIVPVGTAKDIALFLGGGAIFSGGMALKQQVSANVLNTASVTSSQQATAEQG